MCNIGVRYLPIGERSTVDRYQNIDDDFFKIMNVTEFVHYKV